MLFKFNLSEQFRREHAFVIPFCVLILTVVFGIASFAIDIGNARYNLRKIQIAADASSMAALVVLGSSTNYTTVKAEVDDMVARNGVSPSEVTKIDCGTWNLNTRTFTSQGMTNGNPQTPICNATTNAVQVSISRDVATFFGKIFNTATISPATTAISSAVPVNQCTRPFVIRDAAISGLVSGQTFTLDGSAAGNGNWGKLEYAGGNGAGYSMMNDQCSDDYRIGGQAPAQTGSANIGNAFEEILGTNYGTNFVTAITSTVMSGNTTITVTEFVRLTLISTNGNNGNGGNGNSNGNGNNQNNGFSATFRIEERGVLPNPDPLSSARTLVK